MANLHISTHSIAVLQLITCFTAVKLYNNTNHRIKFRAANFKNIAVKSWLFYSSDTAVRFRTGCKLAI